ncbi:MAG: DUF2079 domain-containing protein [Leptolyngbyaceae cyanobacterium CSU_1_3]|nr:DUF2079 domain-containing protein [Leptolyngbyaceae cyanobacterium CSU_1_3]
MVALNSVIFFACSSVRHVLFQSSALDLGYFDQAIYLISQGLPPIVSFWGYHFMGGHADWILYLVAWLYKLYPSVYWLFAIQAISLSIGALPLWHLARQAGLSPVQAKTIALSYLLYPLLFNLNLFDFHPEVMALPLILTAVLAARADRVAWFTVCVVLILGCRDALSLTVAAMGFWLLVFEKKRRCGAIALTLGAVWFGVVTQVVIPAFRPGGVESVARYSYLGGSLLEVVQNLFLKPWLILGKVFSIATLFYLFLLLIPIAWGLSLGHFAPIVAALPTLVINILSELDLQRDLLHQYSLPALPFLYLSIISALSAGAGWLKKSRIIVLWSLIAFLSLAKYGFFAEKYLDRLDTWQATQEAIAQIQTQGAVLTTSYIATHLTHRPVLEYTKLSAPPTQVDSFQYVLLNLRHPGWASSPELAHQVFQMTQANSQFRVVFQRDDVYLFVNKRKDLRVFP